MSRYYRSFLEESVVTPSYPSSLKLFIDAGNPLSYSGSGTTVTDLIGTQNGTLTNGVLFETFGGGSFYFDGTNDYINFGINTIIQPTSSRTLNLTFRTTTYSGILFSDGNSTNDRNGTFIAASAKSVEIANASGYQYPAWGGTWSAGVWYMITIRWNGTAYSVMQNGVQVSSTTLSYLPTNGVNPTLLGSTWNGTTASGFAQTHIGQLKIYNEARTDAQVLNDWNLIKSRYGY